MCIMYRAGLVRINAMDDPVPYIRITCAYILAIKEQSYSTMYGSIVISVYILHSRG